IATRRRQPIEAGELADTTANSAAAIARAAPAARATAPDKCSPAAALRPSYAGYTCQREQAHRRRKPPRPAAPARRRTPRMRRDKFRRGLPDTQGSIPDNAISTVHPADPNEKGGQFNICNRMIQLHKE